MEDEKEDESLNPDSNADILRIHAAMSKVITEAEAAAERGDIDAAQVHSRKAVCCRAYISGLSRASWFMQDLLLGKLEHLQVEKGAFMVSASDGPALSLRRGD